jgi:hypothetical protein
VLQEEAALLASVPERLRLEIGRGQVETHERRGYANP